MLLLLYKPLLPPHICTICTLTYTRKCRHGFTIEMHAAIAELLIGADFERFVLHLFRLVIGSRITARGNGTCTYILHVERGLRA